MKNINLTTEQKIDLEALHATSRDVRVRDRIKAVLLRFEGWSTAMIAQALRVHEHGFFTSSLKVSLINLMKTNKLILLRCIPS